MKKQEPTEALTLYKQNIAEVMISYSRKVKHADMEKISCSKDGYDLLVLYSVRNGSELDIIKALAKF